MRLTTTCAHPAQKAGHSKWARPPREIARSATLSKERTIRSDSRRRQASSAAKAGPKREALRWFHEHQAVHINDPQTSQRLHLSTKSMAMPTPSVVSKRSILVIRFVVKPYSDPSAPRPLSASQQISKKPLA